MATPVIKLFLTDIDGCLSEPYSDFDLEGLGTLRRWASEAAEDGSMPQLGICSGRSYAYVEAVAQLLGLRGPALFESGGGRFDLQHGRIRWSSALTDQVEAQLDQVRAYFLREIVPRGGFSFDYGKRAQTGVVSLDQDRLARALEDTHRYVEGHFPDLMVADTHVSIDIVPRGLSKRVAIEEVAAEEGLNLSEIAFIGDTTGDICALEVVGASFAPANAQAAVRQIASIVTEGAVLQGVIEAYEWCVARNRARRTAA